YTITLRNQDNTKSYGDCSKDFSVTEAASAQGNCYIEGSLLKYSIQGANNVSSIPVTLSGSDNLGNILGFATINMGELKEGQIDLSTQNLTAGQEYVFNISISGVEKRCGTYTPPTATSSSSTTSSNSQSGSLTANCKFTNNNDDYSNVLPGMNNLYFTVANLSGDGSEFNPTITYSWGGSKTIKCNTTCWENQVSVPTTVGTYTYTLSHNGSTICSATLNVVPPLTCSVSASEAQVNTEVTFSASTPASKCWNCSITGGKEAINNIGEWTQSAGLSQSVNVGTSSGKKTLKISCTCDNISAQCSQDVTAKAAAPSFDCGATIAKVGETNNVKIKLDNVQGCDDGCNYTIVGTSVTGNGYSSGNLPPFTGNGADGTSESFNVEITNSTETTTKSCKVDYSASGVIAINENDATDFAPGSYTVTCSGANTVSCWSADGTQGLSMNFNGTSCAIGGGAGWNNCGNNSCTSTPTTLQTNYDIKCKAMY
ncbi:MAG: hypothetical protein HUK20_07745, partial [Fibrobacter sp.]|nr:hypothetical protein [Fibrobacter sp.]